MPASDKQRAVFGKFSSFEHTGSWGSVNTTGIYVKENRTSMLRDYYRRGQRLYRTFQKNKWMPTLEALNDLQHGLNETQREGFLMGWQSDAYADEHNLGYSVQGSTSLTPLEYNMGGIFKRTIQ